MKTQTYKNFKAKQNEAFNEFLKGKVFWAFNKEQWEVGMKSIGLENTEENKKLLVGWYNGATRKTDVSKIEEFLKNQTQELHNRIMKSKSMAVQAFYEEFMNHECGISGRYEDARRALGYTIEDINNNDYLREVYGIAYKSFINWCDKHCW